MSAEPPRARAMECTVAEYAELERWCRAKILAALDRWQDEEISRRLATEKRRTKRKTESAPASRGSDNATDSLVATHASPPPHFVPLIPIGQHWGEATTSSSDGQRFRPARTIRTKSSRWTGQAFDHRLRSCQGSVCCFPRLPHTAPVEFRRHHLRCQGSTQTGSWFRKTIKSCGAFSSP